MVAVGSALDSGKNHFTGWANGSQVVTPRMQLGTGQRWSGSGGPSIPRANRRTLEESDPQSPSSKPGYSCRGQKGKERKGKALIFQAFIT